MQGDISVVSTAGCLLIGPNGLSKYNGEVYPNPWGSINTLTNATDVNILRTNSYIIVNLLPKLVTPKSDI